MADPVHRSWPDQKIIIKDRKKVKLLVELDEFKAVLNSYTKPLVEVRDSL